MSDAFELISSRVLEMQQAGIDPDRVVVSAAVWDEFKERADVAEGEGWAGADKITVHGVEATWRQLGALCEVIVEVQE